MLDRPIRERYFEVPGMNRFRGAARVVGGRVLFWTWRLSSGLARDPARSRACSWSRTATAVFNSARLSRRSWRSRSRSPTRSSLPTQLLQLQFVLLGRLAGLLAGAVHLDQPGRCAPTPGRAGWPRLDCSRARARLSSKTVVRMLEVCSRSGQLPGALVEGLVALRERRLPLA